MAPTSPNSCAAATKAIRRETQRAKQQQQEEAELIDANLGFSQRQKQILREARSSSAVRPNSVLRVYRSNWRGAQERRVIKQMIGDLKPDEAVLENMKQWVDHQQLVPNQSHDHHQAINPPTSSALKSPSIPVEEVVSNNNVNDIETQKIVFPSLFKQLAEIDQTLAAADHNKDNSTGVLVTRDYLSNFGICSDHAMDDDFFLPPRRPYSTTAVHGALYFYSILISLINIILCKFFVL